MSASKKEKITKHHIGAFVIILVFIIFGLIVWLHTMYQIDASKDLKIKALESKRIIDLQIQKTEYDGILNEYKKRDIPTNTLILYLQPKVDPELAMIIGKHVDVYSEKYRLPKNLVLAIIFAESSFNPFATSKVGAIGLTQVFPKAHPDKIEGLEDTKELYHISTNIDIGCKIFRGYFDAKEGNLTNTFNAYLSMNATKEELWKYKNNILDAWAKLDMYYYQLERKE